MSNKAECLAQSLESDATILADAQEDEEEEGDGEDSAKEGGEVEQYEQSAAKAYVERILGEEVEAAVEIATDYGTYVAVHAYHDRSYQRALDAGVRSFEHGFLVSEDIVKQMAAKGEEIVWSFQCYMSVNSFGAYETMPDFFTHEQKLKGVSVGKGARNAAKMMKQHESVHSRKLLM